MVLNNRIKFGSFLLILFLVTGIIPLVLAVSYTSSRPQYSQPGTSSAFLRSQGISLTPGFDDEQCGIGQDFILQVDPLGCSPTVVRSDLLEDQNVPVFCKISATKINPLIDVDAIEYISFSGDYPKEVSGVGFHPAQAAIRSDRKTLLNSPILNNVGYAVIVLKKQKNQSSMPDWIEGNLTARIRYDIEKAFGVGQATYYIEATDEVEWAETYKQNGFWKGRGYLRVKEVDVDSAEISVYVDKENEVSNFRLKEGEKSSKIYLPGSYCRSSFEVKLDGLENPTTRVRLEIDGDIFEVAENEKFLENRCRISDLKKNGLSQEVSIRCNTDEGVERFELSIEPRLLLDVNGETKDYGVGDVIFTNDAGKKVSLAKVDLQEGKKTFEAENIKLFFNRDGESSNLNPELWGLTGITIDGTIISFIGYANAVNKYSMDIDSVVEGDNSDRSDKLSKFIENYDGAIDDYEEILTAFSNVKFKDKTYGEEALLEAIKLSRDTNQNERLLDFCEEFMVNYPDSNNLKDVDSMCGKSLSNSNSELDGHEIYINGDTKTISFRGIYEPSYEDYNAQIIIGGLDVSETRSFSKNNEIVYFNDGNKEEYLKLVDLFPGSARVSIRIKEKNSDKFVVRNIVLEKNRVENIEGRNFKLIGVNVNKLAKLTVLPSIKDTHTEASFNFKIGVEKRGIDLSPEEINKKIKSLDKKIKKWEDISGKLGEVVKGFKAACFATQGYLTIKSFMDGFSGKGAARQEVTEVYRDECREKVGDGKDFKTMSACLLDASEDLEKDINSWTEIKKNYENEEIDGRNIGDVLEGVGAKSVNYDGNDDGEISFSGDIEEAFTENGLKERYVSQGDARRIRELNELINSKDVSEGVKEAARKERYTLFEEIREDARGFAAVRDAEENADELGIVGGSTYAGTSEDQLIGEYSGSTAADKNKFEGVSGGDPIQRIVHNGGIYYVSLEAIGNNEYRIVDVYDSKGNKMLPSNQTVVEIKSKYSSFRGYDSTSYNNEYKDPELRYYETGGFKGYPQVVPFDITRGWYAATVPFVPGNLKAYDDSGRTVSFYVCNVGRNGREENKGGDDICRSFNPVAGQIYGEFPGLTQGQTTKLVKDALSAVNEAQKKYKAGISGKISILGQSISIGSPAINLPGQSCEDFMSPKDCNLLFNVCDPVMCPESRCNLGGEYYVSNVIGSGIVGSSVLCLPNFKGLGGDVYVPVCLSGIKAGVDGLVSVFQNYRDCLQHNLDTGETVGICDEVHSIYLCEFFWRQAAPLAKLTFTKLLNGLFSGGKGGGEYMGMNAAWDRAENSVNYFTQYYAVNSFEAFKARSTDEVGSQVCKNFISARYPASGEFFDALIEPDSPSQFHAWFHEILFTTATVPATSHYKVFYHIYAGDDQGASYQVYLRSPEGTSVYNTAERVIVANGFIERGNYASETRDLTAAAGYKELCVSVNAREECGFKQVSTSFAVDYIKDQYVASQIKDANIKSEKECISGNENILGLITSPNIQENVNEAIDPNIRQRGVVRVCSTENPGRGTDPMKWAEVGTCDGDKGKLLCWLDKESVNQSIDIQGIADDALESVASDELRKLYASGKYIVEIGEKDENIIKKAEDIGASDAKILQAIDVLTNNFGRILLDNQKADILLRRGRLYGILAKRFYDELGEVDKNVGVTERDKTVVDGCFDLFVPEPFFSREACTEFCNRCGFNCVWSEDSLEESEGSCGIVDDGTTVGIAEERKDSLDEPSFLCKDKESCQAILGFEIVNIAKEIKSNHEEILDGDIVSDTGALNFECLALQIAMQESSIQHCKELKDSSRNSLYCHNNPKGVLVGDNGKSMGVMQINTEAHPTAEAYNFYENVRYALEDVLLKGYNDYGKGGANGYVGWQVALRTYNGLGSGGDPNYVENVMGRRKEIISLFKEDCAGVAETTSSSVAETTSSSVAETTSSSANSVNQVVEGTSASTSRGVYVLRFSADKMFRDMFIDGIEATKEELKTLTVSNLEIGDLITLSNDNYLIGNIKKDGNIISLYSRDIPLPIGADFSLSLLVSVPEDTLLINLFEMDTSGSSASTADVAVGGKDIQVGADSSSTEDEVKRETIPPCEEGICSNPLPATVYLKVGSESPNYPVQVIKDGDGRFILGFNSGTYPYYGFLPPDKFQIFDLKKKSWVDRIPGNDFEIGLKSRIDGFENHEYIVYDVDGFIPDLLFKLDEKNVFVLMKTINEHTSFYFESLNKKWNKIDYAHFRYGDNGWEVRFHKAYGSYESVNDFKGGSLYSEDIIRIINYVKSVEESKK